jgi:hypothetical protein
MIWIVIFIRNRLVIHGKIIWDNDDFESSLNDETYLPPKAINDDVVSIGGWRINIQSTIHADAKAFEVINAFNEIKTKLKLCPSRLFLPFFLMDIRNFFQVDEKLNASQEPLVVVFLRLCYWYYRCSIKYNLEKKNKEIRDKLKVSNTVIDSIKNNGLDSKPTEWFRHVVGVVYELMCASLSGQHKIVSFHEKHDFFLQNNPVEVKTIFPPIHREYNEFYPDLSNNLRDRNSDLRLVTENFIKIPKIMKNNLETAIDRQQGKIIFLNLILSNLSSVLAYLAESTSTDLTFKNSLDDAINMLTDESNLPLIISSHAIYCKYQIFSFVLPIPITRRCPCLSFGGITMNKRLKPQT